MYTCIERLPLQKEDRKKGMGSSVSKKVERTLIESPLFNSVVEKSFQDSVSITHHSSSSSPSSSSSSSIYLFQLLDAATQIYHLIPPTQDKEQEQEQKHGDGDAYDNDAVSLIKVKWLHSPPSQFDVDRTLHREESLSTKTALSRDEFFFFARCLFRDMAMVSAENQVVIYVPAGAFVVICAHLTLGRLPFVGPMYRSIGLLPPGLLLGSVIGAIAALRSRFS